MHVGISHVCMLCYDSANSTDFQLWNILVVTSHLQKHARLSRQDNENIPYFFVYNIPCF